MVATLFSVAWFAVEAVAFSTSSLYAASSLTGKDFHGLRKILPSQSSLPAA